MMHGQKNIKSTDYIYNTTEDKGKRKSHHTNGLHE